MVATGYRIEALYPRAEQYIEEARTIARGCLCCLAEICRRHTASSWPISASWDAAYKKLSEAREHYEQRQDTEGIARVLIHRGTILDAMGRYPRSSGRRKERSRTFRANHALSVLHCRDDQHGGGAHQLRAV